MMTPNKLGPAALRRCYWVWLIGGIIFSVSAVYNLFFAGSEWADLTYLGLFVPVGWFGCAAYCSRRLKYLANKNSNDGEEK